jgi:hypothetical protein
VSERDNRGGRSRFDGADWREGVWRELDQIRETIQRQSELFERTLAKLESRDERRDEEISELRLQVNALRNECKRNLKRDAGLASVPTVLVAAIVGALNYFASQPRPVTAPTSAQVLPTPSPPVAPAPLYVPALPEH